MTTAKAPQRVRKAIQPDAYNQVVSHATLQGIRLIHSKFDVKPRALSTDRSKWAYSLSDDLGGSDCNDGELLLRGDFTYNAACIAGRSKLVTAEARYLATFKLSSSCDAEAGEDFLRTVGRFACYPYFRALFAAMTDQCGLLLPPLPVISTPPRIVQRKTVENPPGASDEVH